MVVSRISFVLGVAALHTAAAEVASSPSTTRSNPNDAVVFSKACFVPPASPTATQTPLPWLYTPEAATATQSPPTHHQQSSQAPSSKLRVSSTRLDARKTAKKSSGTGGKKIQVKLLKHVAGTGQAGEVVLVNPAFYNNKLRPTKSAKPISDEQVAEERQIKNQQQKELMAEVGAIRDELAEDSFVLVVTRKAGPDGQLFGGVGPKAIMAELREQLPHHSDFWGGKNVKITALNGSDGKKIRGDLKHTGDFSAMIALTRDINAKLSIRIQSES